MQCERWHASVADLSLRDCNCTSPMTYSYGKYLLVTYKILPVGKALSCGSLTLAISKMI